MSVPIPGKILEQDIIFGMSFNEIIVLAAIPIVLILPSSMIDAIPIKYSFLIVILGFIGVIGIVLKSPDGQSPIKWFPAYVERRIKPNRYTLKPRDNTEFGEKHVKYLDVVHTADKIKQEQNPSPEDIEQLIEEIDYAEKLDIPESVKQKRTQNSLLKDTLIYIKTEIKSVVSNTKSTVESSFNRTNTDDSE